MSTKARIGFAIVGIIAGVFGVISSVGDIVKAKAETNEEND